MMNEPLGMRTKGRWRVEELKFGYFTRSSSGVSRLTGAVDDPGCPAGCAPARGMGVVDRLGAGPDQRHVDRRLAGRPGKALRGVHLAEVGVRVPGQLEIGQREIQEALELLQGGLASLLSNVGIEPQPDLGAEQF